MLLSYCDMVQVIRVLLLLVIGYLELVKCAYSDTSETREILHLDGIWNCYCERDGQPLEYREKHGLRKIKGIVKMPVPGSLLDFDPKSCPGSVWYERSFFVPKSWKYERKILIRLDGAASDTVLWLNGETIGTSNKHFDELDVTDKLVYESENRIALEVKKTRTTPDAYPEIQIPRSVSLLCVPEMLYIQSISVGSTVTNGSAFISYKAIAGGLLKLNAKCISVQVLDKDGLQVASNVGNDSLEGHFSVPNFNVWWPQCMDSSRAGYLYTLVFRLYYKFCESEIKDVYRMKIGIRPLSWSNSSLTMNEKSFYLQGVRGSDEWARKPFSPSSDLKDVTLLKWLHSNAFVTSVAPAEETLDLADELGLFVILGSPKSVLEDVIIRYRHHPSVILWSISEGGHCNGSECKGLNDSFIERLRFLDSTRPFTADVPLLTSSDVDMNSKLDIISLGLENAVLEKSSILQENIKILKKPVILMYGDKFLSTKKRIQTNNFNSNSEDNDQFDNIKKDISLVGEFYGNFIAYESFKGEILTLVDGIFNRNREPTTAADFVRSKFGPKRSPCVRRTPRCKFSKNIRKRLVK